MYLIIYENEFWMQKELSEGDRDMYSTGYANIIDMSNEKYLTRVNVLSDPSKDEWTKIEER